MRRLVLFVAFIAFFALPSMGAQAASSPFTVSEVQVDASAASASEAARIAIDQGRRKAWSILIDRLVPQQDRASVPAIGDDTLRPMIQGYMVSNEKRSTTRYVADVTYTFNGELVRRFLRGANIAYADTAAPPLLVIPMAPNYAPDSDWTQAWSGISTGAVPLVLPIGDALDKSILAPLDFANASWSDIQPVASRVHVAQAVLVLVSAPENGHVSVNMRVVTPSQSRAIGTLDVPVAPGAPPGQIDRDAAQAAAKSVSDTWQARNAVDFNRHSTLTAEVKIDSLSQWGTIQQRLSQVPVVTNVKVAAMNIGQAEIVIGYAGSPAQLNNFLSQAALQLTNQNGVWWLSASSASSDTGGME